MHPPPRVRLLVAIVAALGSAQCASSSAQGRDDPVIRISGPTVIAFWTVPRSDAELEADPELAAALDDQQFHWSRSRELLSDLGIQAVDQPGRSFLLRDGLADRPVWAHPDSSAIGYVLVAPGEPLRVLYRLWLPDTLVAEARAHFGGRDQRRIRASHSLTRPRHSPGSR